MFLAAKPGWLSNQPGECHTGRPAWSKVWIVPHICISVCTCFPWISQDLQSLFWLWKDHRGCEPTMTQVKTPGGWRRNVGDSPPNSTWVFLANSHSSWNKLRTFLTGGKQSYTSRTPSRVNATFPIDSFSGFRQISSLFPAPFPDKMRITKFAYDLSPSIDEVSQEHLNWGQWICKDVKTSEINSVQLQVYLYLRWTWLCLHLTGWCVYNTWYIMSPSQLESLDDSIL